MKKENLKKENKTNKTLKKENDNKENLKISKSKIILTIITILLFLVVLVLAYLLFSKYVLKKNFENDSLSFADKNQNTIFTINNIIMFSSADAKNKTSSASNFTIENLYQYTDMAIFIKNNSDENTLENTLKKVSINNVNFDAPPSIGEPKLYFKSINNFAKSDIIDENAINDSLEFNISSEDETSLDSPILYNNLANPITLSYVNSNVKTDYTITDTSSPITYDGSLLQKCNIDLSSINCKLSFDINITNNLDQEFKTTVFIDLPLQDENNSILNGSITSRQNTKYTFYRYK